MELVREKLSDLVVALYAGRTEDAVMECADAANYLAMIADNALSDKRRLDEQSARPDTHGTLEVDLDSSARDAVRGGSKTWTL